MSGLLLVIGLALGIALAAVGLHDLQLLLERRDHHRHEQD
jgi:hypothetical protein